MQWLQSTPSLAHPNEEVHCCSICFHCCCCFCCLLCFAVISKRPVKQSVEWLKWANEANVWEEKWEPAKRMENRLTRKWHSLALIAAPASDATARCRCQHSYTRIACLPSLLPIVLHKSDHSIEQSKLLCSVVANVIKTHTHTYSSHHCHHCLRYHWLSGRLG